MRVREIRVNRSIPAPAGEPVERRRSTRGAAVYPRACGGTSVILTAMMPGVGLSPRLRGNQPMSKLFAAIHIGGLSPRLRGNLFRRWRKTLPLRSIPAPAGEPGARRPRTRRSGVYPRACGGTDASWHDRGRSPRVYPRACGGTSSFPGPASSREASRSIPAPAGEPIRSSCPVVQRCCPGSIPAPAGEPVPLRSADKTILFGLSPRLRGNPLRHHSEYLPMRL